MKIGELEDLFERYRSQQDLRALGKLFDLAAPELYCATQAQWKIDK